VERVFLGAVMGHIRSCLERFEPQHLANTINGLVRLDPRAIPPDFLDRFVDAAYRRLPQCKPQVSQPRGPIITLVRRFWGREAT
jgi:hypothetical protein